MPLNCLSPTRVLSSAGLGVPRICLCARFPSRFRFTAHRFPLTVCPPRSVVYACLAKRGRCLTDRLLVHRKRGTTYVRYGVRVTGVRSDFLGVRAIRFSLCSSRRPLSTRQRTPGAGGDCTRVGRLGWTSSCATVGVCITESASRIPAHPHHAALRPSRWRRRASSITRFLGATARFGEGDAGMTAGRGIVHSEMFPLLGRSARIPWSCSRFS